MISTLRISTKSLPIVYLLIVTVIGYFTHFHRYENPPYLFWDENYHIASAQKYLHGTFFMEPHPPLGKLLIALGEWILKGNERSDQFLDTQFIEVSSLPSGFSFVGYRFFPTLLSWLTAPLFFLLLLSITRNSFISFLLSSLYLFDNAIIVHNRGAMLESTQIFFLLILLISFVKLISDDLTQSKVLRYSILFGLSFGCMMVTKINSLICILLVPAIFWRYKDSLGRISIFLLFSALSFIIVYMVVWHIHFSIATKINPALQDDGFFSASPEYKVILEKGLNKSLFTMPLMLKDSFKFFKEYEKGVPRLNLCKNDENGSISFLWPIGARAINYRWEMVSEGEFKYLYLVANPAIWAVGLIGLLVSLPFAVASIFTDRRITFRNPFLLWSFSLLYLGYMVAMSQVTRVMYLYHYFIPLIFSFLLFAVIIFEIEKFFFIKINNLIRIILSISVAALSFIGYKFYSPLTYYKPIKDSEFSKLAIINSWDLRCFNCTRTNLFADPKMEARAEEKDALLLLSGLPAEDIRQQWGDPKMGVSVDGQPFLVGGERFANGFGVHAFSSMHFSLNKRFSLFSASVGIPDYKAKKGGSVVFQIFGDGNLLWESPIVRPGAPLKLSVPVKDMNNLELRVTDSGDGNTDDHGCWLDPKLE